MMKKKGPELAGRELLKKEESGVRKKGANRLGPYLGRGRGDGKKL